MTTSTAARRTIESEDLLPYQAYAGLRAEARRKMAALKQHRRIEVGPCTTFYFENFETIRHQIQEMLHIEKGGEAQLADEIAAYAPLIPRGDQLIATVMIEIDEPVRRKTMLQRLGGIEHHGFLRIEGEEVRAAPDAERENTSPEGKASSVQFFTFTLPPTAVAAFKRPGARVELGFDHPNYGHLAVIADPVRAALAGDLD